MRTHTIITFYDNFLNDEVPVTFPNSNKQEAINKCLENNYTTLMGKMVKVEEIQVPSLWDRFRKLLISL